MGKGNDTFDEQPGMKNLPIKKGLEVAALHDEQIPEDHVSESRVVAMPKASQSRRKKWRFTRKKKERLRDINFLISEQFKTLKIRILQTQNGNPPHTLLISSVLPDEGKTTVSANLAITIAKGVHEHALLVDCDFKKADLHKRFGLTPKKGLADYLSGNADLNEIFLKTHTPKLTLIPVGKRPSNPFELLASEKMKHLIQELKTRYNDRYIIFDTSPIQITAEPTALLKEVDGVILVVRANKTNREMILRIMQDIEKKKFLGIVLNRLEKSLSTRYYYNYYSYY